MFNSINQAINASLTKRKDNDEKGFTLIELLVVVLIIGILAAIAIPVFIGQQNKAKDAAAQSDVASAKTALISIETNNSGTFDNTTVTADSLKENGFVPTDGTSDFAIYGDADSFCIEETSAAGNPFSVTESETSDAACSGGGTAIYTDNTTPATP